MKRILRYRFRTNAAEMAYLQRALLGHVNSGPWRNCEAGTCLVIDLQGKMPATGDNHEATITLWRRDTGHTVRRIDRTADGTLLDGHGNPLPEGQEAVVNEHAIYKEEDFNLFECFAELIYDRPEEG